MNRIRKIVYCAGAVFVAALVGCVRGVVEPTPEGDGLVPIELVGLTSAAEVTRAGIDPAYTEIKTATIIVFNSAGTQVLQRRNINYAAGERVYLKPGAYSVFAVANLADGNCPGASTAANYFGDVNDVGDLTDKSFLSTAATGAAPSTTTGMPMTSIGDVADISTQIAIVTVPDPIVQGESDVVTIKMRSIYTKVSFTIYNRNDSGVTPQSYLVENLPVGSWIWERPLGGGGLPPDYADYLAAQTPPQPGYVNMALATFAPAASGWAGAPAPLDGYKMYSFDLYTLENRRGTVASTDVDERKANAPAGALQLTIMGEVGTKMLYTYVLVGKGRSAATPTDDQLGNYDVDRNCIYHVNVFINGTENVETDSRREYLDQTAVCGDLTSPENGTTVEF
jgi:hypothetical protein